MTAIASTAAPRPTPSKPLTSKPNNLDSKSRSRRSTLVRKRDEAEMDDVAAGIPSSPSKKARVAFSDEVEVNFLDENEKAPELIRVEVRRAIFGHSQNDDEEYDKIKAVFAGHGDDEDAPSSNTMRNYVAALIPQAALLNKSCSSLVTTIFWSDWIRRDDEYVELFIRMIGNIVVAHGVFLSNALRMLVEKFTKVGEAPNVYAPAKRSIAQGRAHTALRYILRLVPTASQVLCSVLNALFPHPSDSKRTHMRYVRSALKIISYAPELQSEILELITDRVVKIDVEIQVDLEQLADDLGEGLVQDLTENQTEEDEDIDDSEASDDESDLDEDMDPDLLRSKQINASVQKLDIVMDTLFEYYENLFANSSQLAIASSMLLSQFSTIILPTYRSRHTQFLQFHYFQTSPELIDNFVGSCLHVTFDKTRPAIVRQSATVYLASFVARGRHVPASITRDVFTFLGTQLNQMRADYEPSCRGPDPRRYQTFYALAQALFYIFCFRWRDFLAGADDDQEVLSPPRLPGAIDDEDNEFTFIPGIKDILWGVVHTRMNPLRVCAPAIVLEFAKITEKVQILYVYSILEANKRVRLIYSGGNYTGDVQVRETALSARRDEEYLRLDAYFPFDPYKLPRSRRWVDEDYREWQGIDDDDEDGESDEE